MTINCTNISVWTAARPVATIVYIALIIFDRIECFYSLINTRERAKRASAPETHIFMPQKCDIFVWLFATPSAIIVNTVYIILVV